MSNLTYLASKYVEKYVEVAFSPFFACLYIRGISLVFPG